jgi:hypothetical protein
VQVGGPIRRHWYVIELRRREGILVVPRDLSEPFRLLEPRELVWMLDNAVPFIKNALTGIPPSLLAAKTTCGSADRGRVGLRVM